MALIKKVPSYIVEAALPCLRAIHNQCTNPALFVEQRVYRLQPWIAQSIM